VIIIIIIIIADYFEPMGRNRSLHHAKLSATQSNFSGHSLLHLNSA